MTAIKTCILFLFSYSAHATMCDELLGEWTGKWQDHKHHFINAKLFITSKNKNKLSGKYSLENHTGGSLNITCIVINKTEAFLRLQEERPWYNPCRGSIKKNRLDDLLHIYCFQPNESGFFVKNNHFL